MYSYCTNYAATLPDISVNINCDTVLALNLNSVVLSDHDELVFVIKNYDYIDSPYVYLFRANKQDIDRHGEVIFKVPQSASKFLKHGAFYTLAIFHSAFNTKNDTVYKKLDGRGKIVLDYGAHDFVDSETVAGLEDYEIVSMRLEPIGEQQSAPSALNTEIIGMHLELVSRD